MYLIPAWWVVPAFFVGAFAGVFLAALISAHNRGDDDW
jgi:hypothetical protein